MRRSWVVVVVGVVAVAAGVLAVRGEGLSFFSACGGADPAARSGAPGLWVMNADGANARRVIEGRRGGTLAWSPDSARIVSFREPVTGSTSLVITTVDGSERRPLTAPRTFTPDPPRWEGEVVDRAAWAPDGTRILFVASPAGTGPPGLFAVNSDGTGRIRLASGDELHDLAWSPDGEAIAFSTGFALGVMNTDGSGRRIIAEGPDRIMHPAWAPDGRRIVFSADHDSSGRSATRLEVVNGDGSGRRVVSAQGGRYFGGASWSPDGQWIVFDNYPHEDWGRLTVVRPDGSDRHDVTAELGKPVIHQPAWAPDGSRIVYVENGGIAVVAPDGSRRRCLIGTGRNQNPVWSPDGTMIAFLRS